tara:strand:+ start:447 stop:1205 length:759 start_codon:yes stop_codon:yes gene_type:complete
MNDEKKLQPSMVELINSDTFGDYLCNLKTCKRNLDSWADTHLESLVKCGNELCEHYNELRMEFNKAHKNTSVYILPSVRVVDGEYHDYLTFRWVKFINGSYRGKPKDRDKWVVEEIKRRGKSHFSETDFRKEIGKKGEDFLPVILEVEHCFRYLRKQYQIIKDMSMLSRKLTLGPPLHELSLTTLDTIEPALKAHVADVHKKCKQGIFTSDPLGLKKGDSLFDKFYKEPSIDEFDIEDDFDFEEAERTNWTF